MENKNLKTLVDRLAKTHTLTETEYAALIRGQTPVLTAYAAEQAVRLRKKYYGNTVYIRGLIEISCF